MNLPERDLEKIKNLYALILELLKQDFLSKSDMSLEGALGYISSLYSKMPRNSNPHPTIYNLPSDGVLSLAGYQVCRTTNAFLHDFLNILNFKVHIQYIYIDGNNDWHRVNACEANHMVVCANRDDSECFLDLYSGIYFDSELQAISVNADETELPCRTQIEEMGSIIDKYKTLQELGVYYVYTYDTH